MNFISTINNTNNPQLTSYLQYNNPNIGIIRTGQPGDEYVQRSDNLPVIHGMITLLEIPSERYGVRIDGFTEVDQEYYQDQKVLAENEILVYYPSGIIMFNPIHEGKTFLVDYEGRGVILLSSDRIYLMYQKDPSVLKTLTDHVREVNAQLKIVNERIKRYEEVAEQTLRIADEAKIATDQANEATRESIIATDNAIDAYNSSLLSFKPPVVFYEDLESTYPNPENGYWVQVLKTGDIYRYDGVFTRSWQRIGNVQGEGIPLVSETTDGLMTKEDYAKFIARTFGAALGTISQAGIQQPSIQVPYDAMINKIYAYSTENQSNSPIEITIEKMKKEDFPNGVWKDILSSHLIFSNQSNLSSDPVIVEDEKQISSGDYFRFNVIQLGGFIKGVTVQFEVKQK